MLFGLSSLLATFIIDLKALSLLKLLVWRIALCTLAIVGTTLVVLKGLWLEADWLLTSNDN